MTVINKRPMFLLAVSLAGGIVSALVKQPYIMVAMIVFIVTYTEKNKTKYIWTIICIISMFLMCIRAHQVQRNNPITDIIQNNSGKVAVTVDGRIEKIQIYDNYQAFSLKNPIIIIQEKEYKAKGVLILYSGSNIPEPGETIRVTGTIECHNKADNQGQFDAEKYYRSIGMEYKIYGDSIIVTKDAGVFRSAVNDISNMIADSYMQIDDKAYSGIYKAMVLGEKSDLDKDIKELYQMSGIIHILSISGLHIAIVGMSVYRLLRRMGVDFLISAVISGSFIVAYGIMTGNGVSTIRAYVMFIVFLGAQLLGRKYDVLSAMSLSAIIILAENPLMITNTGFLLSFGAVMAISIIFPILKDCFEHKALENILVSCSVNLLTMPVILYNYFEIPIYSVLLNVLVVPLMSLVMTGAVLGGLAGIFSTALGKFFIGISHYIIDFYNYICKLAVKLPFSVIRLGRPEIFQIVTYYLLLIIILKMAKTACEVKQMRVAKVTILTGSIVLMLVLGYRDNSKPYLTMLDVSQGECVYLNVNENNNIMVDCGSSDVKNVAKNRVIPYLKSEGVSTIKYVFLSHLDEDHISGIEEILQGDDINIEYLFMSKNGQSVDKLTRIEKQALQKGCKVIYLKHNDEVKLGVSGIKCLYPEQGLEPEDSNTGSMVLEVDVSGNKILLTGDIDIATEEYLLNRGRISEYDILKVAHHGSKNSTGEAFLNVVKPKISLISCGKNNSYGHPHNETLQRIYNCGSALAGTAERGQITITFEKKKISVKGYR